MAKKRSRRAQVVVRTPLIESTLDSAIDFTAQVITQIPATTKIPDEIGLRRAGDVFLQWLFRRKQLGALITVAVDDGDLANLRALANSLAASAAQAAGAGAPPEPPPPPPPEEPPPSPPPPSSSCNPAFGGLLCHE